MHAVIDSSSLAALHDSCFACGASNARGLKLNFAINPEGLSVLTWNPSASFQGYSNRVHGGVLATLLDAAMVHALFARGLAGVTAELTLRYLRPVRVDAPVHVTGWVHSNAHGLFLCRAAIHQADALSVSAKGKFISLPETDAGPDPSSVCTTRFTPKRGIQT